MTIWVPELDGAAGPKYLAIADAIARDVSCGRLAPGARLPTHRDLADRLQVTVGTVSRAYAEAKRRGLVAGEVGRGTFIRQPAATGFEFGMPLRDAPGDRDLIDLSMNSPALSTIRDDLAPAFSALANQDVLADILCYQPNIGTERHRRAGARWMGYAGMEAEPDQVVVSVGAQHALLLAFSVISEPGDLMLTEALTYPGMNSLARLLRLRLAGIAMDEHGLRPDALAEACRRGSPRAIYVNPTIQNPTAVFMPESRRREIAAIAEAQGIYVIEDDIYAYLTPEVPRPISALVPDLGFRVDGLSKSVAPGLRVGYLRAPKSVMEPLAAALMTTAVMASPFTAEVAATIIEDGTVDRIVQRRRREIAQRQKLTRDILGAHVARHSRPESLHVWLGLPEPWRAEEFVVEARARGVLVASPEIFAVGHSPTPHAVRLSIGVVDDINVLERSLHILAELLVSNPRPQMARL